MTLCAKTLDGKSVGGKHDTPVSSNTRQVDTKVTDIETDSGSGRDVNEGSGDSDEDYAVEEPDIGSADIELTTCQMLYNEKQRDNKGNVGTYIPQCTPDGQFVPVQCHDVTGQCWCVDVNGRQITGTMHLRSQKQDCSVAVRKEADTPFAWFPNVDRSPPIVTHSPVTDDGIIIDRKTGRPPAADSDFDVISPSVDEDESDGDYAENRVALASRDLLNHPGILAAIIGGSVFILLCLILLIMFIVYRMRKKDEGSYALDEPKKKLTSLNGSGAKDVMRSAQIVYTKGPMNDDHEFYA
jgi:hypothetical protein